MADTTASAFEVSNKIGFATTGKGPRMTFAEAVHAPMFDPVKVPSYRRSSTNRESQVRAASMAAIEVLHKAGMTVKDATKLVCLS